MIKSNQHSIEIKTFRSKWKDDIPSFLNAMEFFLDKLLKQCTIDYKLNIKITLKDGPLSDGYSNDKSLIDGMAWEHETNDGIKKFHIHLNGRVPFLELLSTLAHETVHVVQFATGRLRFDEDDWVWEGTNYGSEPYTGDEDIDEKLPWEYDAYSKETDLARKFVKQYYLNW